MPFAYFGAKHGLSSRYPAPTLSTIIEPFAGSAGYSVRWASPAHRVILVERDPAVVDLWRQVQRLTLDDLRRLDAELMSGYVSHPFLGSLTGSAGMRSSLNGDRVVATSRMFKDWPNVRRRLYETSTRAAHWTIVEGDYTDAPDIEATWFVDPPYQPHDTEAGSVYRHGADALDYDRLGDWCRSRVGQTIVCEQHPADWLPFRRFANQSTGATSGKQRQRVEVVWTRQPVNARARIDRQR